MTDVHDLPRCPVAVTVSVIGSKWKLLILQQLSTGRMRFSELQAALDGISKKVLSTTLRSLEADSIVIRDVHIGSPISVEYALSDMGRTLQPVLDAMGAWGARYRKWREHSSPGADQHKEGGAQ